MCITQYAIMMLSHIALFQPHRQWVMFSTACYSGVHTVPIRLPATQARVPIAKLPHWVVHCESLVIVRSTFSKKVGAKMCALLLRRSLRIGLDLASRNR